MLAVGVNRRGAQYPQDENEHSKANGCSHSDVPLGRAGRFRNEGRSVTVMISIQPIPAVRAGSLSLDDHGDPLPSPDAECGKAELFIQSIHTIEEGHEEPAAAGSNGMTQRHSAT